jgi:polar amino acid transport system substrate-binding protein
VGGTPWLTSTPPTGRSGSALTDRPVCLRVTRQDVRPRRGVGGELHAGETPSPARGTSTVGTGNPAYPPWYAGGDTKGTSWQLNDPATGQGYESAVVYAVAHQLCLSRSAVHWIAVPFDVTYAPGPKPYDFAVQQISYTPQRAQAVSFRVSYYDVNPAVVGLKGAPISHVTTVAQLRQYRLASEIGTTEYDFIQSYIRPVETPGAFNSLALGIEALKNRQVDGVVIDLPNAFYITSVQLSGKAVIVGQFARPEGHQEYFGFTFVKAIRSWVASIGRSTAHRHRVPGVQSLSAHDRSPQRHARAEPGRRTQPGGSRRACPSAVGPVRARGQGSGGQQQRVAIVRALAMRPRILLLDEVTSALDPELVGEVLNVVRELADEGMTLLIATHEMTFARDVAHRVCFLDDGVIREEGAPDQVFGDPADPAHPAVPAADHGRRSLVVSRSTAPSRSGRGSSGPDGPRAT